MYGAIKLEQFSVPTCTCFRKHVKLPVRAYLSSEHKSNILLLGLGIREILAETHLDLLVLSGIHLNI